MASAVEQSLRTENQKRVRRHAGIGKIVVCLDRSPFAETCLPHAIAMARVFDASLTLVHVLPAPHAMTQLPAPDPLGWEIARQEAQAYLDRLRAHAAELRTETRTLVAQGEPAARIVSVASEIGADLTILASHGESGRLSGALGSTVQQVLAMTRGSVFVSRPTTTPPADVAPKRIMVPLDGSTRTECVLPTASRIAQMHGAEIVLVHVVSEPAPTAILSAGEDLELARALAKRLEAGAQRYLGEMASQLGVEQVKVRTIVERATDERQALLELSEREHIDLMIVSAHGSTCNPARAFGSMASYLLSHARPPLLVIQDLPEAEREVGSDLDEPHAKPLRGTAHSDPAEVT